MKKYLQLFILITCLITTNSNYLTAQEKITNIFGTVVDSKTGTLIPNASVFFSFSTFGDMTDSNGEYKFEMNQSGTLLLVCVADGYQKSAHVINTDSMSNFKVDFSLTPYVVREKEKQITSIPREQFLEKFKKEFIGESSRSLKCEILNEGDLEFSNNGIEITASSQKPLIVLNKSLGYELFFTLDKFSWEWFGDNGFYNFDVWFKELAPKDNIESERWKANKDDAYKGSFRHFLKSCADGNAYDEGFRIFFADFVPNDLGELEDFNAMVENQRKRELNNNLRSLISENEKGFEFNYAGILEIVYINNGEDYYYRNYKERNFGVTEIYKSQDSWLQFPLGKYLFNQNGIGLENEESKKAFAGYWAWKRICDILPVDYKN